MLSQTSSLTILMVLQVPSYPVKDFTEEEVERVRQNDGGESKSHSHVEVKKLPLLIFKEPLAGSREKYDQKENRDEGEKELGKIPRLEIHFSILNLR